MMKSIIKGVMQRSQYVKKSDAAQAVANRKPEKSNRTGQFILQLLALFTNKAIPKNLLHVPTG